MDDGKLSHEPDQNSLPQRSSVPKLILKDL